MRRRRQRLVGESECGRGLAREGRDRVELLARRIVRRQPGLDLLDALAGGVQAEHVVRLAQRLGLAPAHQHVEEMAVGADVLGLHLAVERVDEGLRLTQDALLVGVAVRQQLDLRARDQRRQVRDEAARDDDHGDHVAVGQCPARMRQRHLDELHALAGLAHDAAEVERAVADVHDVRDVALVHEGHARPRALTAQHAADEQ